MVLLMPRVSRPARTTHPTFSLPPPWAILCTTHTFCPPYCPQFHQGLFWAAIHGWTPLDSGTWLWPTTIRTSSSSSSSSSHPHPCWPKRMEVPHITSLVSTPSSGNTQTLPTPTHLDTSGFIPKMLSIQIPAYGGYVCVPVCFQALVVIIYTDCNLQLCVVNWNAHFSVEVIVRRSLRVRTDTLPLSCFCEGFFFLDLSLKQTSLQ